MADYLVVNRFDDEFGEYHRFAEPGRDRLAYLTLAPGLAVLDTTSALDTLVVPDLSYATLASATARLTERHGHFDAFVGMSEWDLMTVARLSEHFGAGGWSVELVSRFRDKPRMKELVSGAGLAVPGFLPLRRGQDAAQVIRAIGLPLVLKPRDGAASAGVRRIETAGELETALAGIDPDGYECEEFIDGDIFHVDGVRRDGGFHFVSASGYLGSCLRFSHGEPLGSVLLPDGEQRSRVVSFAAACLDALGLTDGAFHLELFGTQDRGLVFLEVGLRPGGAEVPFLHRELFGVDLFGEAFRATVGGPPHTPASEFRRPAGGGWVLAPEPRPLPSRLVSRTPMLGSVPTLYAEVLPEPGEVFDGDGGYWHVGGRFRFAGEPGQVRGDAAAVMTGYRMVSEPTC